MKREPDYVKRARERLEEAREKLDLAIADYDTARSIATLENAPRLAKCRADRVRRTKKAKVA